MPMWTSARQTKRKIDISLLSTSAHILWNGGESKLETLLHGNVNFCSTNEVEVLIVIWFEMQVLTSCCMLADARYGVCVGVGVAVVSKLETLLHSCNLNWRPVSIGRSSSASPRKFIPVNRGTLYSASQVERGCRH